MLESIVAVYADWGIGADGTQPVTLRADRAHFRAVTKGAAVIVGRRTLADFPGGRPLPGRVNIVLSLSHRPIEGATVVHSMEEALTEAARHPRCLVIGGESVFLALLPHIDRVYVTKLDICPHSDAFFPNLDADPDFCVSEQGPEQEENGVTFRFLTYTRRGVAEDGTSSQTERP